MLVSVEDVISAFSKQTLTNFDISLTMADICDLDPFADTALDRRKNKNKNE